MSREDHTERTSRAEQEELSLIRQGAQALAELSGRIAPRFGRVEVRSRVGRYLRGLLATVERKNGWQLAEELGDPNAHGVQRLLAEAEWDEEAVRDDVRAYVIEHLGEAGGVLVVDETGFVKKGKKSAGVARQYSGTAGRWENSQIGVFLLYASTKGYAFIDRALYLPEEWTADRVRCREASIPDEVGFATKGELAQQMLARAFAAGVPADWVLGDTIYGYDEMRMVLEQQQQNYVLAVPETHTVWVQGRQQPVGLLAALLPQEAWVLLPAETEAPSTHARWVLMRRSLVDPSERAYYRVYGPATITLPEVVQVTGSRWRIEEGYEQAKGEVGLDQYEVRTWRAWYRYVTLALLAYAALVVMRGQARAQEKKVEQPRSGST